MFDTKRLAIIAIAISLVSLILSINSYFRFGGMNEVQNMLISVESSFETKYNIRTALDQLHEASIMSDSAEQNQAFKSRIDSAVQFLGIAKITAKTKDQKTISEIKEQLRKISKDELWKKQKLRLNFDQMHSRLREIIGE